MISYRCGISNIEITTPNNDDIKCIPFDLNIINKIEALLMDFRTEHNPLLYTGKSANITEDIRRIIIHKWTTSSNHYVDSFRHTQDIKSKRIDTILSNCML